jgi:hypothetical protein
MQAKKVLYDASIADGSSQTEEEKKAAKEAFDTDMKAAEQAQ